MNNPNPACGQAAVTAPALPADEADFALFERLVKNLELDDPVALRRNELRVWAEAAGFADVDVRNLGEANFWEMRCNRGTNRECATAAEVERGFGILADEHQYQIAPDQFVAIVEGDRIAARFRLTPLPAEPV
jgi:hypothetical protein